jgi:hypothetical protein
MRSGVSGVNAYFRPRKLHGSVGQLSVRMSHLALAGKGEGEGLSAGQLDCGWLETPHLIPLPFSKEGEATGGRSDQ